MEQRRSRVATGEEAQLQAEWRSALGVSIHTLDVKVDALQAQVAVLQATYTSAHAALVARVTNLEVEHEKAPEAFRGWSGLAVTIVAVVVSLTCGGGGLLVGGAGLLMSLAGLLLPHLH